MHLSRRASSALALLLAASACAGPVVRDTSGQAAQLTARSAGGVASFPLDLATFFPEGTFGDAVRVERDNGRAYVDTVTFRGVVALSYQWTTGDYALSPADVDRLSSRANIEALLARLGVSPGAVESGLAPVSHPRYPSFGFTYSGPGRAPGITCAVGQAAYGVRKPMSDVLGFRTADAALLGGVCGPGLDPAPWVALFNGFTASAP